MQLVNLTLQASSSASFNIMNQTAICDSVPLPFRGVFFNEIISVQPVAGTELRIKPEMTCCSINDIAFSAEAGLMLVGRRVLARSKLDGYYYKGKVINQVVLKTLFYYSISLKLSW